MEPEGLLPCSPEQAFLVSVMRATYSVHLTLTDLISLIIFGEEYILRCSTLCIFLQSPGNPSLLDPDILSTFSQKPSIYAYDFSLGYETHTKYQPQP
jgi:hypothetical protein